MKRLPPLYFVLAATLLAAPAFATHWEGFDGTADCDGWSASGQLIIGSQSTGGCMNYVITLSQDGMIVQQVADCIPFGPTGPQTMGASGTWEGDLCGDYIVSGVFTITGVGDLAGDPERSFETPVTCECDEPGGCTFTPGYWKNHEENWPVFDFALGGVDYVQAELDEILSRPVRGDATVILAHHLIAAMLNVWNGADDGIQGAIDAGNQFLADHGLGSHPSGVLKHEALAIKDELADYNELHCGEGSVMEPNKDFASDESVDWGTVKSLYR